MKIYDADIGEFMHIDNVYHSIFMNAVEGIFQSTPDGQYLNVNPSLARMYGYDSPEELIESITNIADQLYVDPVRRQEFIHEMQTHGIVKDFVSQIHTKNDEKIWISENVRIVKDDDNILYYEGFVSDITQLCKTRQRNKTLQIRLQQAEKMDSIGKMARGIAHDLNNILSPIIGYSDLLIELVPNEGNIYKYVNNISKAAGRAKDLVKQIHTFGQPETQKKEPIQVENIIKEVLNFISGLAPDNIKIEHTVKAGISRINADAIHIHQILMNLCTNAIHAMEESGGELTVKLSEHEYTDEILNSKLLNLKPGKYIDICIKDTGSGIPQEIISKIFDPYFTTKDKGKGKGIGLATVHSIVKNNEGDITVKSKPGSGTIFHVYLPSLVEEKKKMAQDYFMTTDEKKLHIMLVDDDQDVLQVQGMLFEQMGHKVTLFSDGKTALDNFNSNPEFYDLVVTDLNMPNMDGLELSRSLINTNATIPIILCTGYINSVNEATTQSAGIKKLVSKPLTSQKLATLFDLSYS